MPLICRVAYLALPPLAVTGFRNRRRVMEVGQHFSPGCAVELGDVVANGAGVSCGVLLGLPIRTLIAVI